MFGRRRRRRKTNHGVQMKRARGAKFAVQRETEGGEEREASQTARSKRGRE
jgi:hypothetical protein